MFDLIEYQNMVNQLVHPRDLFEFFDHVCQLYERKIITRYERDEIKDMVFEKLKILSDLEKAIK